MPAPLRFVVPPEKLSGYLLDLAHPAGGSKATFLLRRGFAPDRPDELEQALRDLLADPQARIRESADARGRRRLVVDGVLFGPDGSRSSFRTVWQDDAEGSATLVTAHPRRVRRA